MALKITKTHGILNYNYNLRTSTGGPPVSSTPGPCLMQNSLLMQNSTISTFGKIPNYPLNANLFNFLMQILPIIQLV